MARALNSQEKRLRLKTTFVVKPSLMWFELNTGSVSFAINRLLKYCFMCPKTVSVVIFHASADTLQGVDCLWLPSKVFKENWREEYCAIRLISQVQLFP